MDSESYCVDPANIDPTEARIAELLQTGAFYDASVAAYWVGADMNQDDTIDENELIAFFQQTCETLCAVDSSLCGCRMDPVDQLFGLYQ